MMVIDGEQLVLDMVVDEKQVLHRIDDEQLVLHNFVVMDEVSRIVVVEEMLKTMDYTVVGCTIECCKMESKYMHIADQSLHCTISFANLTSVAKLLHSS
ncbi:hypothetical protein Tco_0223780 [Tanacetum coccineum]